jgi:ketosteroid isomerase-like protein
VTDTHTRVLATIEQMTTAFESADLERVMSAYEPGAVVVFEPGRPVSDPAILRATFSQWFALTPRFEYSGHEVFVSADIALHIAPWRMEGTAPDGSAIEQTGLSVAVLRRQPDGRWRLVIDDPFGQHLLENVGPRVLRPA